MRELKPERIREMTEDDILVKIRELKEELFNLRFRNTVRQLQNPLLLREKRRDVARLETILTEHRKGIRLIGAAAVTAPSGAARTEAKAPATARKPKAKAAAKAKSKPAARAKSKPAAKRKAKKS
jgi:large subunit ribosomal protein L29